MKKLLSFIRKYKVISTKDAANILGHRNLIYPFIESGEVIRIGGDSSGLFTLSTIDEGTAYLGAIARYYPKCIISGKSALSFHGLIDDFVSTIVVDIPKTTNLKNSILEVHRVHPSKLIGIEEKKIDGVKVKIYCPERAIADGLMKYGYGERFYKSIHNYHQKYEIKYDLIIKYDELFKLDVMKFINLEDSASAIN